MKSNESENNKLTSTPVTDEWLTHSPLPPLIGAQGVAERLVLLVHFGVDFNIWGGNRRGRYWSALDERVKASTYSGPTLFTWWANISSSIVSEPRNPAERTELLTLLNTPEQKEVLKALRMHSEVLVLRVRVLSEHRNKNKSEELT